MKRLVSMAVAAFVIVAASLYAMPSAPAEAQTSASLSIAPKKTYNIDPGKSIKDTLVIRNLDGENPLTLSLRVVDFTFNDDSGTPKLMLAEDAPQTAWSLRPFITVPKEVTIEPKQSKTIDMGVAIPANQGGGSYYSAIVYSSSAADGGNVGLSASGVTLVFSNVTGDANQKLTLEKLGAYHTPKNGKEGGYTFFTMQKPDAIAYTLKNDGNVAEAPVGSVTLRNMFGKEYTINDVNPNGSLALIGQSRTFTPCIKLKAEEIELNGEKTKSKACTTPSLWPGFYSVNLDLYYGWNGENTQDIQGKASFIYLPLWFVIVLVIGLIALLYAGFRLKMAVTSKSGSKKSKSRK